MEKSILIHLDKGEDYKEIKIEKLVCCDEVGGTNIIITLKD